MTNNTQYIESILKDGVLTLILKDPKTKNAVGAEMASQLINSLSAFSKDDRIKVLLITGANDSFCSGANVRSMKQNSDMDTRTAKLDSDPWKELDKSIKKEPPL